ncbi:MAG: hypothetical protein M1129_03120 [Candidatus Thermoplasmatota archaeon]|jgi:hypothetical protein|nr:hypothetical protein [Candidatus Thermoplasmatota archaeon]
MSETFEPVMATKPTNSGFTVKAVQMRMMATWKRNAVLINSSWDQKREKNKK